MIGNIGTKFYCEFCDLKCRDKYDYNKHIETKRHKIKQNKTYFSENMYNCECGKSYTRRSSLYNHKKTCNFVKVEKEKQDELISLVKQQNKKIEQLEQTIKDNPPTQNITNNNQFNLNIFLNEKCKDAINIIEFKKIVLEAITDISGVIEFNINDALTNAINVTYNNLDNYEKPYYTLDKSRNKLAVKDENNEWVKDNTDIVYDNLKILQQPYCKTQLENFYKSIKDRDNMNENQEEQFIDIVKNMSQQIDKTKFLNKIVENSVIPKQIK